MIRMCHTVYNLLAYAMSSFYSWNSMRYMKEHKTPQCWWLNVIEGCENHGIYYDWKKSGKPLIKHFKRSFSNFIKLFYSAVNSSNFNDTFVDLEHSSLECDIFFTDLVIFLPLFGALEKSFNYFTVSYFLWRFSCFPSELLIIFLDVLLSYLNRKISMRKMWSGWGLRWHWRSIRSKFPANEDLLLFHVCLFFWILISN